MNIGERIRAARLRSGLTQKELSAKVGCSRNHISAIESGACLPSMALWLRNLRLTARKGLREYQGMAQNV
ncbi:MAG: hypothetical protein Kow0065_21460 [Methylomicrobium sp.]